MFDIVIVLTVALLGFRLLGALGAGRFATWTAGAAHAMAVMLVVTASAHFVPASVTVMPNHADLARMVPSFVPYPDVMVYVSGVLELLGAAGLVLSATRRAAGICLAALFALLLPANVYAAVTDVRFNGDEATPLWFRIPEQLLYIAVALWVARSAGATTARHAPGSPRPRLGGSATATSAHRHRGRRAAGKVAPGTATTPPR
ncbi:DoxX family protein [Streptosporangium sp. CA-135522]|uniref:DoxX family protein n=1 Tax=Streptosporangium sp. CA-135522 TaxID=3240072 RepID=UPI003D8A7ED8